MTPQIFVVQINGSIGKASLFTPMREKQLLPTFWEKVAGKDSHVAHAPTGKQAAAEGRQMKTVLGTEAED